MDVLIVVKVHLNSATFVYQMWNQDLMFCGIMVDK